MIKDDRPGGRSFCRLDDRDLLNGQPFLGRSEGVGRRCIVRCRGSDVVLVIGCCSDGEILHVGMQPVSCR